MHTMAIEAGIGTSTARDHILAVKEAVSEARLNLGKDKIDLVFIFSSAEFAHPGVLKLIEQALGPLPVLGCSGFAVISSRGITKHGLVIMLLSLPEGIYLNTAHIKEISRRSSLSAGEELGEKLLYGFRSVQRSLSIIFSDGLLKDSSELINGLQERLGRSFPLVGASSSDNLAFERTSVYCGQEVSSDSCCGLLLGGKLNFGLGVKHGWKPLGKPRRVTASKGNTVVQIDNTCAVKIYEDYFSRSVSELKKDLKRISTLYPIGIYLSGEDEYLLRNISSIEEDGSLVFQGNIPQDSQVRLMIGTKESCLNATHQAAEEVRKNLSGHKINFLLVFDSVSRYILLGRQAEKELEAIQEEIGRDTPLVGVYTYGEQAPLRGINYLGRTYFHNQTVTILGIAG